MLSEDAKKDREMIEVEERIKYAHELAKHLANRLSSKRFAVPENSVISNFTAPQRSIGSLLKEKRERIQRLQKIKEEVRKEEELIKSLRMGGLQRESGEKLQGESREELQEEARKKERHEKLRGEDERLEAVRKEKEEINDFMIDAQRYALSLEPKVEVKGEENRKFMVDMQRCALSLEEKQRQNIGVGERIKNAEVLARNVWNGIEENLLLESKQGLEEKELEPELEVKDSQELVEEKEEKIIDVEEK